MTTRTSMLMPGDEVVARIHRHIEQGTTDVADGEWTEPVEHYLDASRFTAELGVLRRAFAPLCPSAAVPEPGSYLTVDRAGVPIIVARSSDGDVGVFRNACRHRGAAVACGSGHAASFVCPYHGWVYQLDGQLRRVPHDHGFPGLDIAGTTLARLPAFERHGFVFAGDDATDDARVEPPAELDELAGLITDDFHYAGASESEHPVNWKILVETFLEGYHIRFLHHDTFFPVQYDNVNVVEQYGPNSRITFPYRNIERPFDATDPAAVRGRLTFVHHCFPNVMIPTFPGQVLMIVLDPLAVDRTMLRQYVWKQESAGAPSGNPSLVEAGGAQDFDISRTIQHGLASGANEHLRFGRFEGAIQHFHRTLDAALAASDVRD